MKRYYYKLEGHDAVPCADMREWSEAFSSTMRIVQQEKATRHVKVSTVFLGIDHSFGSGPPILFETMIFGGPLNEEMLRYATWAEAVVGHEAMVRVAKKYRYYKKAKG